MFCSHVSIACRWSSFILYLRREKSSTNFLLQFCIVGSTSLNIQSFLVVHILHDMMIIISMKKGHPSCCFILLMFCDMFLELEMNIPTVPIKILQNHILGKDVELFPASDECIARKHMSLKPFFSFVGGLLCWADLSEEAKRRPCVSFGICCSKAIQMLDECLCVPLANYMLFW